MSLYRIDGDPYAGPLTPVLIAASPFDYKVLCAEYIKVGARLGSV